MKILVVDDDQTICRGIKSILESTGHVVFLAGDTHSAEEILKKDAIDLVIVDLLLPHTDGLDFIRDLHQYSSDPLVLMISGFVSTDTTINALKAGAADFLPKPFSRQDLMKHVSRLYRRKHLSVTQTMIPPPPLYSFGEHTWVRVLDPAWAEVGIDQRFLLTTGKTNEIRTCVIGFDIHQGGYMAQIVSSDTTTYSVWAPVSGRIEEINPDVYANLDFILENPYHPDAWIMRVHLFDWLKDQTNLFINHSPQGEPGHS